jgi:glycosyltransferase involved in cell wall biosynthesis
VRSIAIVIPVYNRADQVSLAIESVMSQVDVSAHIIVVDDGSTDHTARVLAGYEARDTVRLIRHPRNLGASAAKNTGLDAVPPDTDLVGILDSDDVLLPGALAALAAAFDVPAGADWSQVFGWCRDAASGAATGAMVRREGPITYDDALAGRFAGEFWQLARMDLIGDRRFEPRARGGESVLWWRLLRDRPAWLIPETVRAYDTSGSDRISLLDYSPRGAGGTMWVYLAALRAFGADLRRGHPQRYAEQAAELAKWAALAGRHRVATAAARSGWRAHPSRRGALAIVMSLTPAPLLRLAARSWSMRPRRSV